MKKSDTRRCWGVTRDTEGNKRQCAFNGVPVVISGSFGDAHKILCAICIERIKKLGWKVTYQLGGAEANVADAN